MDDTSEGDTSDLGSPSLPSLPTSLQQQMALIEEQQRQLAAKQASNQPQQQQQQQQHPQMQQTQQQSQLNRFNSPLTIKEVDKKLADLRRENFNLKLRLYFVEKDKNGVTKPEYESAVTEEMVKREKAIRAYQRVVNEKENEIESLKAIFDEKMKKKDEEIALLNAENGALKSDLQVNNSVCRSLMSHLNEMRLHWRNHLLNSSSTGNYHLNDLLGSLSNWLNTSDDLLNSASVLIAADDCGNNDLTKAEQTIRIGSETVNENTSALGNNNNNNGNHNAARLSIMFNSPANNYNRQTKLGFLYDDYLLNQELSRLNSNSTSNNNRISNHNDSSHLMSLYDELVIEGNHISEEKLLYLKHREELYHLSSDSEDDWSEPDRDVARARVGGDLITSMSASQLFNANKQPVKHVRSKRRSSGMSSLGIISNLSEIIESKSLRKKSQKATKNLTRDDGVQTDLTLLTLDAILYDYQSIVNKELRNNSCQTNMIDRNSQETQTNSCTLRQRDQCTETIKETMISRSLQISPTNVGVALQTENLITISNTSTQTEPVVIASIEDDKMVTVNDVYDDVNTSQMPNEKILNGQSPCLTHVDENVKILSEENKEEEEKDYKSSHISFEHIQTSSLLSSSNNRLTHLSRDVLPIVQEGNNDTIDNIIDEVNNHIIAKSFPTSPVKRASIDEHLSNSDCQIFKMPNNDYYLSGKVKKATITKITSTTPFTIKINKDELNDNSNSKSITNAIQIPSNKYSPPRKLSELSTSSSSSGSSVSSSSSSSHDECTRSRAIFKPIRQQQQQQQQLSTEIGQLSQRLKMTTKLDEPPTSSPDLGIGDSDHDHHGLMRAYLTINNYQLLRVNINELFSIINSIDNISRDYCLKLINTNEFYSEIKLFISSIFQIINTLRNICRHFNVEDSQAIHLQLERMKNRKENMEKMITRQLIKTDKLIKKAKINLKDN